MPLFLISPNQVCFVFISWIFLLLEFARQNIKKTVQSRRISGFVHFFTKIFYNFFSKIFYNFFSKIFYNFFSKFFYNFFFKHFLQFFFWKNRFFFTENLPSCGNVPRIFRRGARRNHSSPRNWSILLFPSSPPSGAPDRRYFSNVPIVQKARKSARNRPSNRRAHQSGERKNEFENERSWRKIYKIKTDRNEIDRGEERRIKKTPTQTFFFICSFAYAKSDHFLAFTYCRVL